MSAVPRTVVFAYSETGHACLKFLLDRGVHVVGVFTHADDPQENLWFPSVASLAESTGIPVSTPTRLQDPAWQFSVSALRPDLIFSFYYRRLIPMPLLRQAPLGAFNMHGSLLPRYRGRAPVNWAILRGEAETGATLHHMVEVADAGDIVDQERVPIEPEEPVGPIMARVRDAALTILERRLDQLLRGTASRHPQDHARATVFGRRRPEDGRIDWQRPGREIFNLVRAVTRPYPGAFADLAPDRRLFVWWARPVPGEGAPGRLLSAWPLRIGTGDGYLEVLDAEWRSPAALPQR